LTTRLWWFFPAILLSVVGWLIYPWLLDVVMTGSRVGLVSPSIDALALGSLWTALSLAWLGSVTSGCVLFLKYKTAAQTVSGIVTGLVLTAVVSVAGWLFFIQYKTAGAIRSLADIGIGRVALSVEDIPVYETGLFASIIVVLATVLFQRLGKSKKVPEKLP